MAEVLSGARFYIKKSLSPNNGYYILDSASGLWLHSNGEIRYTYDGQFYYQTEAEATYRILLYQNPREALKPFYAATGGEYVGTCGACCGEGESTFVPRDYKMRDLFELPEITTCPTCSGTGGPPDHDTLLVSADWFEERDCEMEAKVLRDVAKGGG